VSPVAAAAVPEPAERRLVPRRFGGFVGFSDVEAIAEQHGWELVMPDEGADWVTGWEVEPGTVVRWHEDEETGVQWATVHGPGQTRAENAIRAGMELLTPDSYAAAVEAESRPMARGHMLQAVATAAHGDFDERAYAVLDTALHDEDPFIRRYAILACARLGWPQLRSTIERIHADDPDPAVRAIADEVLANPL
jgi:HEAT repeat protein